ncbi:P-loop NTPase fold protein [Rhizobium sp. Root483D2]|uniref:KAP family P-loop NTPase fold protein n=1 Tax=Rhizobium sp. Root483D2 TaxID=1736545 RepID=UPI00071410E1|nr:P-loop NTPase fold protein [Rhizobium sp. Root483D2]KQY21031.1 hypothetical protein ASD32_06530 [Rhizobium sp. Root483D2]
MTAHWDADLLNRKDDAKFLYNFLIGQIDKRKAQGRVASYVMNVDADWGGGKTFFLEGLAADLESQGHIVARINAWRDDHAQDPYVAIMAAIDKAFEPFVQKPGPISKAWGAVKSSGGPIAVKFAGAIGKALLKKHTGVAIEDFREMISEGGESDGDLTTAIAEGTMVAEGEIEKLFDTSLEALIDGFQRTDRAMSDFREKLAASIAAVSTKRPAPLFILVDELDRCRPTFAVQLLERVKHLFDVEGVVFVFATNSDQLQHSIAGAYGANFNGFRYLKRFFNRTYVFAEPPLETLVQKLCADLPQEKLRAPDDKLTEAISLGFKAFGFGSDLRAVEQIIEMIDATVTAWPHKVPAEISLVFPLCAQFYLSGKAVWPHPDLPALKQWILPNITHDRHSNRSRDFSIYYNRIYAEAYSIFNSMQKIVEYGNKERDDSSARYVNSIFDREWNGVPVPRSAPSVQVDLLGLVVNAGRMANASSSSAT